MLSTERNETLTQVSPGTPMGELIRRYWIPALISDELTPDGRPLRLKLLGEDLVAFRDTSGKVGILEALCPHRKAPLFFGRNEEDGLTCIYHGWKFDTAGKCLQMPNLPKETRFTDRVKIVNYPTQELNGIVWTYMGPPDTMPPELPPLDFVRVPVENRLITKQRINANWAQVLEGDFDPSHISFLHGSTTAYKEFMARDEDAPMPPAPEPEDGILTSKLERYYWHREPSPELTVMATPYGMFSGARREAGPSTNYYRFNHFIMPFYAGPPGDCELPAQCNIWIPMDDEHSIVWRVSYNLDRPLEGAEREELLDGHGAHIPPDGYAEPKDFEPESNWVPKIGRHNNYGLEHDGEFDYFAGIVGIWAQDRACTEGMGPILDRSTERLVSSDAAVAMVRRTLLRAAAALAELGVAPPAETEFPSMTVIPNTVIPREQQWTQIGSEVYSSLVQESVLAEEV